MFTLRDVSGGMKSVNRQDHFLARLARQPACLVTIHATRGSVPREQGTWMAVFADEVVGTIGGGQLEFQAIDEARRRLVLGANEAPTFPRLPDTMRYALGPSLGQCCGGEMHVRYELVEAAEAAKLAVRLQSVHPPLALFGGGHVGKALIHVLGSLPLQVRWIDSRDEIFSPTVSTNVVCEHSDPVHAAVAQLAPGSMVLIMSFSHAEDLDIVAACLQRQRQQADLPFIGLIGSKTKWATFGHRLAARGYTAQELTHVTCPIGVAGITSKEPEVIAVAVAAQILQDIAGRQMPSGSDPLVRVKRMVFGAGAKP
jgi:xanthine dehydrogenase accessory factor